MTLLSAAARTFTALLGCALLAVGACKPAAAPRTAQASPPEDRLPQSQASSPTPHQPGITDLTNYVRSTLVPLVRLAAIRADPPMRMPNALQGSDTWLFNVKVTIAPNEDLFDPCPQDADDARSIAALIQEFNDLVAWRNAYVQSAYAKVYPGFDLKPPVDTVPQLLVLRQAKDRPLAPVYAKVAAEWQVDHWYFSPVNWTFPQIGSPRSAFPGSTMVQGSPEAAHFFQAEREAIAQAKAKKDAIESRYADDLAKAVKPGTTYRGQISHPRGILPCEVRFIDTPGADPQMAMFEVSLPQEPTDRLVYTAKLALEVPLNLPDNAAASDPFHIPTFPMSGNASNNVPVGNLTVTFVRRSGKATVYGPLPNVLLYGTNMMGMNKPFLLLNRRLQGVVSQFNGDFSLNAQQNP